MVRSLHIIYSPKSHIRRSWCPRFFESGDIFSSPILKKRQRNVRCIQKLPCSTEQKPELVDAAVKHLKAQQ